VESYAAWKKTAQHGREHPSQQRGAGPQVARQQVDCNGSARHLTSLPDRIPSTQGRFRWDQPTQAVTNERSVAAEAEGARCCPRGPPDIPINIRAANTVLANILGYGAYRVRKDTDMFASLNNVCAAISRRVDGTGMNCQMFHRHLRAQSTDGDARPSRETPPGLLAPLVKGCGRSVEPRHRGGIHARDRRSQTRNFGAGMIDNNRMPSVSFGPAGPSSRNFRRL
jgi:hypothetical protein